MELWSELHATKETLRVAEDEVTACKREKIRFLETLTKITVNILVVDSLYFRSSNCNGNDLYFFLCSP